MDFIKNLFTSRRVHPAPVDVEALVERKRELVDKFVEENAPTLVMLQMAYPENTQIKDTLRLLREIKENNRPQPNEREIFVTTAVAGAVGAGVGLLLVRAAAS